MFKLIIGRSFEFARENGGVYLRVGKRDWYYSADQGFVAG